MIRSSLATKLLLSSLLPAASVLVAGAGIQRSFSASARAEVQVLTAISALELANDVAALADRAILEERGFLVTGGEHFAEPYYNAVALFAARVGDLERLFADAPERQAQVRELAAVFRRWQDEVATPAIAARRRDEVGAGAALVASSGRLLSNQISQRADRITRAQGEVVRERLLESGRARGVATRWALGVVLVTVAFAVTIGVALALQLRRRLGDLEAAAEALARGDFGRRAPAGASDEIGRLARSFNAMADEVRDRSLDAAGLRKLSELLQACSNVQEAFDVLQRLLPTLLPDVCGVIHVTNSSRNLLEIAARFGLEPRDSGSTTELTAPNDCWAFRRASVHRVREGGGNPGCRHTGTETSDYLCIPLLAHGDHLGVLTLSPAPDERGVARAERVAEQIGLAVANLRLRDSLRTQAIRDGLTGLYNRRYLEEVAERELMRARRYSRPVVFLVLDVDHFKRFNDTYGHDAGDFLLREVGQLLRSSVRQSDIACRYGGEEFVLILPESAAEEARRRADQIRLAFHRLALSYQGKLLGPVTVSIGVAAYPEHGSDREVLLRSADAALYDAKAAGRDRVVVAPSNQIEAAAVLATSV